MVVDRIPHTLPGSAEEDLRTQMERHWVEESCMIVRDHSSVEVGRRNFVSGSLLVEGTPLEVGMMVDHTAAEADSLAEDSLDEILHRNPVVRDSMTWSLASKKDSRRKGVRVGIVESRQMNQRRRHRQRQRWQDNTTKWEACLDMSDCESCSSRQSLRTERDQQVGPATPTRLSEQKHAQRDLGLARFQTR